MGQASSYEPSNTSKKLANFYHICNIIPDTPEHHHQTWQVPTIDTRMNDVSHRDTSMSHMTSKRNRNARRQRTTPSYYPHALGSESGTEQTTDDESDILTQPPAHRHARRQQKHKHRHSHPTSKEHSTSVKDAVTDPIIPPEMLDRRYDLDIAPSMVNMDLRFNGAHMVVNSIYNILVCKFGYHHMLSVQMLFWLAVHKYYQIHLIDTQSNYKLSLCTFLDVVKETSLCSERDLSIYTNIAEKARAIHENTHTQNDEQQNTQSTTFPITTIANAHTLQHPFYTMDYYYVPKDNTVMQQALMHNHLILANLTMFSNFLSARRGEIPFPNSDDQSAGMLVVTLVGYQANTWIVKFPFGIHWGDHGFGYVSFDYFQRYNRDRWIIDIVECGEPPEYATQRKHEQMSGNSEFIAAHMNDNASLHSTHTVLSEQQHGKKNVSKHQTTNQIRRRMI